MVLIATTAIAIVTVISVSSTNSVNAEVVRVQSPLSATGRVHACPDEPLTFICEVNGEYIQWTFNIYYRTTFFYDSSVNAIETVSGQHGVRAILTGNEPIPNNPDSRHLTSALLIDTTNLPPGYLHNISCHSNTDMQAQELKIAEVPRRPLNVQISQIQLSTHLGTNAVSVLWDAPNNSEKFDLEYFKVNVLSDQVYIENGTTTEFEYHFNPDDIIIPPQSSIQIVVTAVSKCSQEGHRSLAVEWSEINNAVSTNVPDPVSTTSTAIYDAEIDANKFNGCKEPIAGVHNAIVFVAAVLSLLMI